MGLGRNEKLHISCEFKGHEYSCPKRCEKCAIAIKTDGDAALGDNRLDDAIKQYKRALFVEPKFAEAWCNLASIYGMRSEYNNALSAFNKALAIDPQYGKAMFGKAVTLKNLGRLDDAMALTNEILELYDDSNVKNLKTELIRAGVRDKTGVYSQPQSTIIKGDKDPEAYSKTKPLTPSHQGIMDRENDKDESSSILTIDEYQTTVMGFAKDAIYLYEEITCIEQDYGNYAEVPNVFVDFSVYEKKWLELNQQAKTLLRKIFELDSLWCKQSYRISDATQSSDKMINDSKEYCSSLISYCNIMSQLMHHLYEKAHGSNYSLEEYKNELQGTEQRRKPVDQTYENVLNCYFDQLEKEQDKLPYPYNLITAIFGFKDYNDENNAEISKSDILSEIETVINTLQPDEIELILLRFRDHMKFREICSRMNFRNGEALVILTKALRKLRHPSRSKRLRDFINLCDAR